MSPQVPKYQAIHAVLRQRILDGDYEAGSQLPAQQGLADSFGVTLMTLRQAMAALEAEGLVWAARGKGTFVADRPVDISLGNLSSFAQQMRAAGVEVVTEILESTVVVGGKHPAGPAIGVSGDLLCVTRRRSVDGEVIALQRSYLDASIGVEAGGVGSSLYGAIEAAAGWTIERAEESITAVGLSAADARLVAADRGHPALSSVRVSFNQFDQPFLYDDALLVGGRSSIRADRTSERLSLQFGIDEPSINVL